MPQLCCQLILSFDFFFRHPVGISHDCRMRSDGKFSNTLLVETYHGDKGRESLAESIHADLMSRRLNYHALNHFPCWPARVVSFGTLLTRRGWSRGLIRQARTCVRGRYSRLGDSLTASEISSTLTARETTWNHNGVLETFDGCTLFSAIPLGSVPRGGEILIRQFARETRVAHIQKMMQSNDDRWTIHDCKSGPVESHWSSFIYPLSHFLGFPVCTSMDTKGQVEGCVNRFTVVRGIDSELKEARRDFNWKLDEETFNTN